jgi:uncharacterized protein YndB with AHSA1/START domain
MNTNKILHKTIDIDAPTSDVWNALTNPDLIKQWLFGTNVISEWKIGSPILFTGTWQGTAYKDKGTILQFEKEKVFQYNYWSGFSGLTDSIENYSIITFKLGPTTDGTLLTLTQSNFPTETAYEHTAKNWDATLELMKKIIEAK